jgi:hypothetical protein
MGLTQPVEAYKNSTSERAPRNGVVSELGSRALSIQQRIFQASRTVRACADTLIGEEPEVEAGNPTEASGLGGTLGSLIEILLAAEAELNILEQQLGRLTRIA